MFFRSLSCIFLSIYCHLVFAHKASDSYLTLKASSTTIEGRWDIALRDLDYAIGLDTDSDSAITWRELRSKREFVENYAFAGLQINNGESLPCRIKPTHYLVDTHTDGAYVVILFEAHCPDPVATLEIKYSLFFDLDPQHRGLLYVEYQQASHTAIFSPTQHTQRIELSKIMPGTAFLQYLNEGIWHIWTGYDHILFLLSLLLPSVYYRQSRHWHPSTRFRPVLLEVLKIVTAFTIAHSVTLSLATFDIISLPSRWVESAIAASVILAALNNLYPLIIKKQWLAAFGFGLVHGLGFANVLKDLGLPGNMIILTLLAFNIGVEAGQLVIVSGFLPLAYSNRQTCWYRSVCFGFGSGLIAIIACVWFLERLLNIKLM